jgi:hypothetical protein
MKASRLFAARKPLLPALAACAALAAAGAPAADASLLGGLLPGVLSPAVSAAACPGSAQTFAAWGDSSYYQLAAGGSFEGGPAWSGNGAAVPGNESFYVGGDGDSHSLLVPQGASVTSAPSCYAFGDVKLRFFARGAGRVRVSIVVRDLLGVLSTLDTTTVQTGPSWQLSPPVSMGLTNLGALLTTTAIQVKLTPLDGAVQLDDVYIDPYKGR